MRARKAPSEVCEASTGVQVAHAEIVGGGGALRLTLTDAAADLVRQRQDARGRGRCRRAAPSDAAADDGLGRRRQPGENAARGL